MSAFGGKADIISSDHGPNAWSSRQGAAEFSGKLFRDCTAGNTPQQEIASVFMPVLDARHLYAALIVERMHRISRLPRPFGGTAISTTNGKSRAMVLPLGRPL